MHSAKPLVIGIGEALWDMFPGYRSLGGASANFAYHAAQLGTRSVLVSAVGEDNAGEELLALLDSKGVTTEFCARDENHATGTVEVHLENGQPTFDIVTPVAWDFIPWSPILATLAKECSAVCFGTLAQRNPVSRKTIRRFVEAASGIRLFDLNVRPPHTTAESIEWGLQHATVLKLNEDELDTLSALWNFSPGETILRVFAFTQVELIALTLGANGCELITATERIHIPAPPVTIRDSVGAGDSFAAALICGLLQKRPLAEVGAFANRVGAFVASQPGAIPDYNKDIIGI